MSTVQDQRDDYIKNPYFTGHIYGNFSPFYVTIAVCTVLFVTIVLLNVVLGCCSKHRRYWQDRHTGNRWLVSIWSATPHLQPPLDLTELKDASHFKHLHPTFAEDIEAQEPIHQQAPPPQHQHQEPQQHRPQRPESRGLQRQRQQREEYIEVHKRESDI